MGLTKQQIIDFLKHELALYPEDREHLLAYAIDEAIPEEELSFLLV